MTHLRQFWVGRGGWVFWVGSPLGTLLFPGVAKQGRIFHRTPKTPQFLKRETMGGGGHNGGSDPTNMHYNTDNDTHKMFL